MVRGRKEDRIETELWEDMEEDDAVETFKAERKEANVNNEPQSTEWCASP